MLAGVVGAAGWFYLANYAQTPFDATAASIMASLGVAVSDVVADSIVVEKVRSDIFCVSSIMTESSKPCFITSRFGKFTSWEKRVFTVRQARDSKSQAISGGLQSLCWGSAAIGGIVSAYFSGALLERMTTREVFSLTTYLPLLITLCALFIDEARQTVSTSRWRWNDIFVVVECFVAREQMLI